MTADLRAGGGEIAPDGWLAALRTSVRLLLTSSHPMFLWWGDKLTQFYNDS